MLLDSLNSRTAVVAAGATILWFLTSQALQLVGLGAPSSGARRTPTVAAVRCDRVGVFTILDVSSFGQLYFLHLALPFDAVLTACSAPPSWQSALVDRSHVRRGRRCGRCGCFDQRGGVDGVASTAALGLLDASWCRWCSPERVVARRSHGGCVAPETVAWRLASLIAMAATIGVAVPTAIANVASRPPRFFQLPPSRLAPTTPGSSIAASRRQHCGCVITREATTSSPPTVSVDRSRASHSSRECRWILGGWYDGATHRAEGWGYTPPAHAAHGVDGMHRNR